MCVCVCVCVCVLPALVPVGGEQDEDLSAMLVRSLQYARETIHQRPLDARVVHLTEEEEELLVF